MQGDSLQPASHTEFSKTAEISRAVVHVHAQFYGRGPTKARTSWAGDHVVCALEEIYTPAERTLIDAGNFDKVRMMRIAFQDAVEPLLRAAVEEATGRSVRAVFSQISRDPPMAAAVFVLNPAA
jgi:uncharacterized protein YbcI